MVSERVAKGLFQALFVFAGRLAGTEAVRRFFVLLGSVDPLLHLLLRVAQRSAFRKRQGAAALHDASRQPRPGLRGRLPSWSAGALSRFPIGWVDALAHPVGPHSVSNSDAPEAVVSGKPGLGAGGRFVSLSG